MKCLLQEFQDLGFNYKFNEQSINITSSFVNIKLEGEIKDVLTKFTEYYKNLNASKLSEMFYKLKLMFSHNYRQRFSYSNDKIKHNIYFNYLSLIEHKRENQK